MLVKTCTMKSSLAVEVPATSDSSFIAAPTCALADALAPLEFRSTVSEASMYEQRLGIRASSTGSYTTGATLGLGGVYLEGESVVMLD